MSRVIEQERVTASFDGPVVLFIIGMRINHFHKVGQWWPVFRAMPKMLAELAARPELGMLRSEFAWRGPRAPTFLQYWRDFDALEAYARGQEFAHLPAWQAFNRAIGTNGDVGIFHETYVVDRGRYENIYANMPPFGLGQIAGTRPATGSRNEARSRMRGE